MIVSVPIVSAMTCGALILYCIPSPLERRSWLTIEANPRCGECRPERRRLGLGRRAVDACGREARLCGRDDETHAARRHLVRAARARVLVVARRRHGPAAAEPRR